LDKAAAEQTQSKAADERLDAGTTAVVVLWLGLVLTVAALTDYVMALYPPVFGSPEWEFATISDIVAGLPLVTIGLAFVWVSSGWLGRRWLTIAAGVGFLVGALCVFGALLLFATNIPVALRATQDLARGNIEKLIAKTLILGLLFGTVYIVAGVITLKRARRSHT
jgi:hypothetical protein